MSSLRSHLAFDVAAVVQRRRRSFNPLHGAPRALAWRIGGQICLQLLLLLLLIEAVFLAEKFTQFLEGAVDTRASGGQLITLLLAASPEIFNLGLPLAFMIAAYRVLLRHREDRELVALAGAGVGTGQMVMLLSVLGLLSGLVSLGVASEIVPRTLYLGRSILFEVEYNALRGLPVHERVYRFSGHTIIASRQDHSQDERRLFIHEGTFGAYQRVIVSQRARLEGPDAQLNLKLKDFVVYHFGTPEPLAAGEEGEVATEEGEVAIPACADCGGQAGPQDRGPQDNRLINSLRIGSYSQEMSLDQLLKLVPRGETATEWTLGEVIRGDLNGGGQSNPRSEFKSRAELVAGAGKRIARGLLCILVPVIAAFALSFTRRTNQVVVLPLACTLVMCLDMGGGLAAEALAGLGIGGMSGVLLAVLCGLWLVVVGWSIARQGAMIKPG